MDESRPGINASDIPGPTLPAWAIVSCGGLFLVGVPIALFARMALRPRDIGNAAAP